MEVYGTGLKAAFELIRLPLRSVHRDASLACLSTHGIHYNWGHMTSSSELRPGCFMLCTNFLSTFCSRLFCHGLIFTRCLAFPERKLPHYPLVSKFNARLHHSQGETSQDHRHSIKDHKLDFIIRQIALETFAEFDGSKSVRTKRQTVENPGAIKVCYTTNTVGVRRNSPRNCLNRLPFYNSLFRTFRLTCCLFPRWKNPALKLGMRTSSQLETTHW